MPLGNANAQLSKELEQMIKISTKAKNYSNASTPTFYNYLPSPLLEA
jgi:hypothetical protein